MASSSTPRSPLPILPLQSLISSVLELLRDINVSSNASVLPNSACYVSAFGLLLISSKLVVLGIHPPGTNAGAKCHYPGNLDLKQHG